MKIVPDTVLLDTERIHVEEKAVLAVAEGIQDEILTKLASIADLKVISRTSTEKYKSKPEDLKTVSQQLGVANVLEGTVQRAGDNEWMTTPAGESVSGAKPPRFARESVDGSRVDTARGQTLPLDGAIGDGAQALLREQVAG